MNPTAVTLPPVLSPAGRGDTYAWAGQVSALFHGGVGVVGTLHSIHAMARENSLKHRLKAGESVFGTWTVTSSPMVANVLASSGLDFVTIDMEHGPTTMETAEAILYAIEAGGSEPMIRFGEQHDGLVFNALDAGAQSLLFAHVSNAERANQLVRLCKYAPRGIRGMAPFTRVHAYSDDDLGAKLERANEQTLVGVLIEDADGVTNLDEICSVPDLDLVYLGMYDISHAFGAPGALDDAHVMEVVRGCVQKIESKGLAAGAVCRDREHAAVLLDAGFRYISYLVDTAILHEGFAAARAWWDELAPHA